MEDPTRLTFSISRENPEFLERQAAEHQTTIDDVLDRHLTRLRERAEGRPAHPSVKKISSLVPHDVDAQAVYLDHLLDKHD